MRGRSARPTAAAARATGGCATGADGRSALRRPVGRDGQPIRHSCVDAWKINCGQTANDIREAIRQSLSHLITRACRTRLTQRAHAGDDRVRCGPQEGRRHHGAEGRAQTSTPGSGAGRADDGQPALLRRAHRAQLHVLRPRHPQAGGSVGPARARLRPGLTRRAALPCGRLPGRAAQQGTQALPRLAHPPHHAPHRVREAPPECTPFLDPYRTQSGGRQRIRWSRWRRHRAIPLGLAGRRQCTQWGLSEGSGERRWQERYTTCSAGEVRSR